MNLVVTGGVDPRHIFPQMFFLADAPWPKEFPARAVKGAAWREDDRAVLGRKFSMISYPVIPNLKKKETCSLNPNFVAVKSTQFSMEQIAGSVKQAGSNEFRKVIIGCNTLHKRPNKNLFIYSRGSLLRVSLLHHGMSLQAISKHSVHRSKNCFKSFVYCLKQCFDHPSVFTRSLNMTHPQALSMEKHLKINCQISDFFLGGVVYCRALGTICQGLFGPTCTQRGARLLGNITSGTMGLGHPWNWWFSIIQKFWRKWSNQKQLVWCFLEVDRKNNNNNNNNNNKKNKNKNREQQAQGTTSTGWWENVWPLWLCDSFLVHISLWCFWPWDFRKQWNTHHGLQRKRCKPRWSPNSGFCWEVSKKNFGIPSEPGCKGWRFNFGIPSCPKEYCVCHPAL